MLDADRDVITCPVEGTNGAGGQTGLVIANLAGRGCYPCAAAAPTARQRPGHRGRHARAHRSGGSACRAARRKVLRHALRPALERDGRAVHRRERAPSRIEALGQGTNDPCAPTVQRVGRAVAPLGRFRKGRPKAAAGIAQENHADGGAAIRQIRHAIFRHAMEPAPQQAAPSRRRLRRARRARQAVLLRAGIRPARSRCGPPVPRPAPRPPDGPCPVPRSRRGARSPGRPTPGGASPAVPLPSASRR